MDTFAARLVGAAKLDARTFEEVEADVTATPQALGAVVLSSLAGGIGALGAGGLGSSGFIGGALVSLVGWAAWAALTYLIGTRLFPEPQTRANVGELLRTTGFASAPGLLRLAGIVPGLYAPVYFATSVWSLAAMVVGVRHALDYSTTTRAVVVCVVGWLLSFAIALLLGAYFGVVVQSS